MAWLIAAGVGIAIGALLGLLGGGGSILAVPALIYLLNQSPYAATTASLVVVAFSAITGALTHHRRGNVRWRQGGLFGAAGVVGASVGALGAGLVSDAVLLSLFALLLMVVAALMFRKNLGKKAAASAPQTPEPTGAAYWVRVGIAATAVGLLTGFFGVGGGFAIVPALTLVLGFSMPVAVGTSLVVIVVNSVVAFALRLGGGVDLDWAVVVPFTLTAIAGTYAGSRLSARIPARQLSLAFATLLVVIAVFTASQNMPQLLS